MSRFKAPSSMELLLDAMCNVFGAVLFASILIGGMSVSRELAGRGDQVDSEAFNAMRAQSRLLDEQLKASAMELDMLQSLAGDSPAAHVGKRDLGLQQRAAATVAAANDLALELNDLQRKLSLKRRELLQGRKFQDAADSRTPDDLAAEEKQLEQQLAKVTDRSWALPEKVVDPKLTPWRYLIAADEFFLIGSNAHIRYGRSNNNALEIKRFAYGENEFFRLIKQPGKGIAYSEAELLAQLENVDRQEHYIELLVEADAVARAAVIVQLLRQNNFLYNWRIVPESGALLRTGKRRNYEMVR